MALALGIAPARTSTVSIPAYALGQDDLPLICSARVARKGPYPAFNCDPYPDGTSGAPWLQRRGASMAVVGVIGGLQQGGCQTWTSYSAPFDRRTLTLAAGAGRAAAAQQLPVAPSSGCSTGL